MIEVVLHGKLRKEFAHSYKLGVVTPSEAVIALSTMMPKFKQEFIKYDYEVYLKKGKDRVNIGKEDLSSFVTGDELHLYPRVKGAKNNTQRGVGKIILSAALFFVVGPTAKLLMTAGETTATAATAAASAATAAKTVAIINKVALIMAISGVSMLLTPDAKKEKDDSSKLMGGSENANNVAVPVVYGQPYSEVIPISTEVSNIKVNNGASLDLEWFNENV